MLTDEGREVANDCITRSGLPTLDILSDDDNETANENFISSCTIREQQTAIPSDILEKVLLQNGILNLQFSFLYSVVNFLSFSCIVYTVWVF